MTTVAHEEAASLVAADSGCNLRALSSMEGGVAATARPAEEQARQSGGTKREGGKGEEAVLEEATTAAGTSVEVAEVSRAAAARAAAGRAAAARAAAAASAVTSESLLKATASTEGPAREALDGALALGRSAETIKERDGGEPNARMQEKSCIYPEAGDARGTIQEEEQKIQQREYELQRTIGELQSAGQGRRPRSAGGDKHQPQVGKEEAHISNVREKGSERVEEEDGHDGSALEPAGSTIQVAAKSRFRAAMRRQQGTDQDATLRGRRLGGECSSAVDEEERAEVESGKCGGDAAEQQQMSRDRSWYGEEVAAASEGTSGLITAARRNKETIAEEERIQNGAASSEPGTAGDGTLQDHEEITSAPTAEYTADKDNSSDVNVFKYTSAGNALVAAAPDTTSPPAFAVSGDAAAGSPRVAPPCGACDAAASPGIGSGDAATAAAVEREQEEEQQLQENGGRTQERHRGWGHRRDTWRRSYYERALYEGVVMFFLTFIPSWNPNPQYLQDFDDNEEGEEGEEEDEDDFSSPPNENNEA